MEKRYIRKDGSIVWANVTASLVRSVADNVDYFVSIAEDITVRKQAEEALAKERNLLRTLIDAIPDYIYVKDNEGRFLVENSALASSLSLVPGELVGKTDFDIHPYEDAAAFYAEEQALLQAG